MELPDARRPGDQRILPAALPALLALLCVASLATRWQLSIELPFIVDELVDMQLAVDVARGATLYGDRPFERMPGLTWFLTLAHEPDRSAFDTMLAARRAVWLVSLLLAGITFWVGRSLFDWRTGGVAVFLLLGFSSFLERSLRLRADLLSTLLATLAFGILVGRGLSRPGLALAGLLLGTAFVTTQKAVYFVLAFAVALCVRNLAELRGDGKAYAPLRAAIATARGGLLSGAAFLLPLACVTIWARSQGVLEEFLEQTLIFGAYVGLSADTYAGTVRFFEQSIQRNPGFWFFGVFGLLYLPWRQLRATVPSDAHVMSRKNIGAKSEAWHPGVWAAVAWTVVLLLCLAQHTAKFPYVLLNLAPFLAISGSPLLIDLSRRCFRQGRLWMLRAIAWGAIVAGLLVSYPLVHHVRHFGDRTIDYQRRTMERVEAITGKEDAVLDGVGMVVSRPKATPFSMTNRWFQERAARRESVIPWVERRRPPIMIVNYRIGRLPLVERSYLAQRYLQDWGPVHVAGTLVELGDGGQPIDRIFLVASARYSVTASSGSLDGAQVGGEPARAVMELAAGEHEVAVDGPKRTLEIRYAPSVETPLPTDQTLGRLFASYLD